MKRLERLYAVIEALRSQRSGPVTVTALAERFNVAERTIYRDIALLRDQDVPIYGETGRDGGVWLGGEYSMPPVGLSIGEAIGLWLAVRLGRSGVDGAAGDSLSSAMAKVLATLPDVRRRKYESVLNRIIVGVSPPSERVAGAGAIDIEVFKGCEVAVAESRLLEITYLDRDQALTTRSVEPHGMLVQVPLWYLLTHDRLRNAPRVFRLDRVKGVRLDPVERFDPVDPRVFFEMIEKYSLELPH